MTNLLYTLLALFTLCAIMAAMIVTFRIVGVLGMTLFSLLLLIAIPMRPIPTQTPQPATETAFWGICWVALLVIQLLADRLLIHFLFSDQIHQFLSRHTRKTV